MPDRSWAGTPPGEPWRLVHDAIVDHPDVPVAVGCSGGPDSSALAMVARDVCRSLGRPMTILHVHHGLQDQADQWSDVVHRLAELLDVPLSARRIQVDLSLGQGVEGAARQARYKALDDMMRSSGCGLLLLGHHRQDQAETVLFRLIRGAGVQGLRAMEHRSVRDGMLILRPWLELDRDHLLEIVELFSAAHDWQPVDDPTNLDPSYARGALRSKLIPELARHWPQWALNLSRHARQAAQASEILNEVAAEMLASLEPSDDGASFSLRAWRELSPARQNLVLRHWLSRQGCQMPSEGKLAELVRQLQTVHALGHDRSLTWRHAGLVVRCERGRVICRTS